MNFHNIEYVASYGVFSQIPKSDSLEIAFSGRSNVGKSSMINKVFNRKNLAKVSSMPGKTTTINFFALENIFFADLPGYGYAKVAKSEKKRWSELIEGYLNDDRNLALIFQLIDIRHSPTNDDRTMINFMVEHQLPFVIILTKKDKLTKNQFAKRMEELKKEIPFFEEITVIPFSAQTGEGTDEIKKIIEDITSDDESEYTLK